MEKGHGKVSGHKYRTGPVSTVDTLVGPEGSINTNTCGRPTSSGKERLVDKVKKSGCHLLTPLSIFRH